MSLEQHTFDLHSPEETELLGRRLGAILFPGAVVALSGELGAGKTFLVRAVAMGLGVQDSRMIASPTFVLIHEYEGRLPIYHFDLYRLKAANDLLDLGVAEYLEGSGVCLIEWADKFPQCLPDARLDVQLKTVSEFGRSLRMTGRGERYAALVRTLADSLS